MKPKLRKEAKTQSSTTTTTTTTATPSELSFAIVRIAVSQICLSVGFKATQLSALETLTLVATKYLQAIAGSAASFTNSSNRTQSNLLDLTNALHDIVSLHSGGLSGSSILHRPTSTLLSASGVLRDLANFVYFHDEIPFAKPIPRPDHTSSSGNSSLGTKKLYFSRGSHVPKWLPGFPNGNNGVDEICLGTGKRKNGESLWEEDLANFVYFHDEIPFAKPIPWADHISSSGNSSSGTKKLDCSLGSHVPKWLPGFPNDGVDDICLGKGKTENGESLWKEGLVQVGSNLGWKNWSNGDEKSGNMVVVEEEGKVEKGRGKVRFKMGSMSGICRLEHKKNNANNKSNGIDKEEKILVYKRRRRRRDDGECLNQSVIF